MFYFQGQSLLIERDFMFKELKSFVRENKIMFFCAALAVLTLIVVSCLKAHEEHQKFLQEKLENFQIKKERAMRDLQFAFDDLEEMEKMLQEYGQISVNSLGEDLEVRRDIVEDAKAELESIQEEEKKFFDSFHEKPSPNSDLAVRKERAIKNVQYAIERFEEMEKMLQKPDKISQISSGEIKIKRDIVDDVTEALEKIIDEEKKFFDTFYEKPDQNSSALYPKPLWKVYFKVKDSF